MELDGVTIVCDPDPELLRAIITLARERDLHFVSHGYDGRLVIRFPEASREDVRQLSGDVLALMDSPLAEPPLKH